MRTAERLGLILAGLLTFGAVAPRPAGAHPVAQGALDIVVLPGRVSVTARVSMEELLVAVAYGAATDGSAAAMVRRHGDYLLGHLRVFAHERQLEGRVVRVAGQAVFGPIYELEYRGFDGVPGRIGVQQARTSPSRSGSTTMPPCGTSRSSVSGTRTRSGCSPACATIRSSSRSSSSGTPS
jgi:hypothetical protein